MKTENVLKVDPEHFPQNCPTVLLRIMQWTKDRAVKPKKLLPNSI
ncbi:hypothetical protein CEV33_1721 [Brucella grignonensis]|uniref:Uncharacterized protein n=1 Tax=Brucella grignonensis TaxID=94627 RepID=A0A256F9Y2_9HYPH|nr:hypothetical protein CEV33_1721 [Brucella grignonensis]